jgi:hypothetical protein
MHKLASIAAVAVVITAVGLSGGVASTQVPQHHVTLTGAKEAPTTGDANGSGEFS